MRKRKCPCDASWAAVLSTKHVIMNIFVSPWNCPAMHDRVGVCTMFKAHLLTHSTSKKTEVPPFYALPHCAGSVLSITGLRNYASIIDESQARSHVILVFHLFEKAGSALLGSLVPGPSLLSWAAKCVDEIVLTMYTFWGRDLFIQSTSLSQLPIPKSGFKHSPVDELERGCKQQLSLFMNKREVLYNTVWATTCYLLQ